MNYIAATKQDQRIIVADQDGETHEIDDKPGDQPYIASQSEHILHIRESAKSCSVCDVLLLPAHIFEQLCANLKAQTNADIKLTEIHWYSAGIEQDRKRSSLFYGLSGSKPGDRWKCNSPWCKARNHYTCEHATFVSQVVPVEAVNMPPSDPAEYDDILTY